MVAPYFLGNRGATEIDEEINAELILSIPVCDRCPSTANFHIGFMSLHVGKIQRSY